MGKRTIVLAIGAILALVIGVQVAAFASHPEVSLPGSNFEIDTDANLAANDASPSIDWGNVSEERQPDLPTGAGDDSFGNGTKEDTAVPAVVDGSIPPNKSDLLNFGVYFEENANAAGDDFLNVFWHRVQEPSGTTNMDFEFNQSEIPSGNGVTPVRTAGDVLIQYDLAQGGTNPQLFVSEWVTTGGKSDCQANNAAPCWGPRVNLTTSGDATGSINTSAIPAAQADGLGNISTRTFGEAQINFNALTGGSTTDCVGFGSAYLKSRSSDSFTAALKDFISPTSVDINQCGLVKVIKTDDASPGNPLDGAEFDLVKDEAPIGGSPGVEDDEIVDSCVTDAGECVFGSVLQGDYWVIETLAPPGHDLASPAFQHVTVAADGTAEITFVDPRQTGAIEITKTRKHAADGPGDHPHAGVSFTVQDGEGNIVPNGQVETDANGKACVDGLLSDSYSVIESVPSGYVADGDTTKTVTVDNKATCEDDPYVGETVSFSNTPLTDLDVSVTSQVPGGTSSTIECDDPDTSGAGPAQNPTLAVDDLEPGTYTCKIVIDP